jgi:4-hydroxythreonine-4-phosphate dehydrogenase
VHKPLIAITQGDGAGIGPEIIVRTFLQHPDATKGCFVVGDIATLRRASRLLAAPGQPALAIAVIDHPEQAHFTPPRCLSVLALDAPPPLAQFGHVQAAAGAFAGRCILWAANAALQGQIQALVTAPIHKEALAAAGAPWNQFPGHTEMLQWAAAQHLQCEAHQLPVKMMLASDALRTVLVSVHVSLKNAIALLTQDRIFETIQVTHQALTQLLPHTPRIAVAGLNPHAGEGGLFGREEIELIAPAVFAAQQRGWQVSGPFAPDTVFMRARHGAQKVAEFDAVIAMYHDQGLIPVKYLGMEQGVNVTLGLPLIRTSPDHGTAFDIAGTGKADPSSMVQALRMAQQLIAAQHGSMQ